ncbi:MAG: hypothetical protein GY908_05985, partial [Flavobacteriales bacterium]|nr:hypothetical protein [Flavobacteriales bacterium]
MKEFNLAKWRQFIIEEAAVADGNFGNDMEDRYAYIRPLMADLPDNARTETLLDFMRDGLREDNKELFDYGFVETMKMLGLEDQLMDDPAMDDEPITPPDPEDMPGADVSPFITDKELQARANVFVREGEDSLINPEAEEIDAEDLDASADYFDSLAENDDILDEMIGELEGEVQTESLEGHLLNFQIQAQKIAKETGAKKPKLVPGKFDSYTMVFPYDQAPGGAMSSVGGVETMSAQEEAAAENRASNAAKAFVEFLRAEGSPVD